MYVGGGGDFVREGLCPCCKIHRGDCVHVAKFIRGLYYVHVYKFEQGGGLYGGILVSYTEPLRSQTF